MRFTARLRVFLAAFCGLPFFAPSARADLLGYGNEALVRIDELTGHMTTIREVIGLYPAYMAMSPSGTIYYVGQRWYGPWAYVAAIDPATWAVVSYPGPDLSGSIIGAGQVRAVAFSPAGTLLAAGTGSKLHTIDVETGVARLVADTGLEALATIAFSPDGTLYGWDIGVVSGTVGLGLVTIDPLTGGATDVNPSVGGTSEISTLAFGPDGTLYGARSSLFTVDTATGELTLVGPLVIPPDEYFGTLSLVWIPEPSTLSALATLAAALLLAHLRRKRKR
jgi:hypothetical protein